MLRISNAPPVLEHPFLLTDGDGEYISQFVTLVRAREAGRWHSARRGSNVFVWAYSDKECCTTWSAVFQYHSGRLVSEGKAVSRAMAVGA